MPDSFGIDDLPEGEAVLAVHFPSEQYPRALKGRFSSHGELSTILTHLRHAALAAAAEEPWLDTAP